MVRPNLDIRRIRVHLWKLLVACNVSGGRVVANTAAHVWEVKVVECERCLWAARERRWGPARLVALARRLLPAACGPHGGASPPYSRGTPPLPSAWGTTEAHVETPFRARFLWDFVVLLYLASTASPPRRCWHLDICKFLRLFEQSSWTRMQCEPRDASWTWPSNCLLLLVTAENYPIRDGCVDVYDSAPGLRRMLTTCYLSTTIQRLLSL